MNFFDQAVALIAPHLCLACGYKGEIICEACVFSLLKPVPGRCYRCHKITRQSSVCKSCKNSVKISHVWVATEYNELAKKALYKFKFNRAKAGAKTIGNIIASNLPDLPRDIVIAHIPTANNRIRIRGYDQAELLAKEVAKQKDWQFKALLVRTGKSRQVGANRKERFQHLGQALKLRPKANITERHILLIDDVTTTGATIEAAAKLLKASGAKTVDVAVFAQPN